MKKSSWSSLPQPKMTTRAPVSGQTFALSLSAATSSPAVEARGVSSLSDLAQNNGDALANGEVFIGTASPGASVQILGPLHDLLLANIRTIFNALPHSSVSGIPSGKTTFAGFTIVTSTHGNTLHGSNDVILSSIALQVTAQNVQIDPASYRLYTPENPAAGLFCAAGQSTGTFTVTCSGIAGSAIQSRIGQGQQVTYLLEATILNTELAPGESRLSAELNPLGQRTQSNAVIWSDEATVVQWVDIPELRVESTTYRKP